MELICSIFALLVVLSALTYYYLTSTYGYWNQKLVPCLTGALPGLGHVHPMFFLKKNMADMFRDFYNQMPGHSMVGFYYLRQPSLLIREPELAKTVLLKNFQNFADNHFRLDKALDPLLSVNPFFSVGDRWKASRQRLGSALTSGKLKNMYTYVNGACTKLEGFLNKLVKSNNGKVEFELKELFSRYSAEVVAGTIFDADGDSFKNDTDGPFKEIGRLLFEPSFVKGLSQMVLFFVPFLSKFLRISFIPAKADQFFRRVVQDVLKHHDEEGIQRPNFIQHMIQYEKSDAAKRNIDLEINYEIITAHASALFFDIYETSGLTLSFLTYQLAAHPEIQSRVRKEVTNVVAKHGGLTYAALQEMTYMEQALNESMRFFPGFGAFIKVCTEETELVGSDGITCQVTPGTVVVIPASAFHRDPEYWPDPDKFDPERFSDENKHSRHRFVYLPFGDGPRVCPGMRMALLQIKAALATIIQNFTWEVSPRTKEPVQLDPKYFMSSALGGLWVNMEGLR